MPVRCAECRPTSHIQGYAQHWEPAGMERLRGHCSQRNRAAFPELNPTTRAGSPTDDPTAARQRPELHRRPRFTTCTAGLASGLRIRTQHPESCHDLEMQDANHPSAHDNLAPAERPPIHDQAPRRQGQQPDSLFSHWSGMPANTGCRRCRRRRGLPQFRNQPSSAAGRIRPCSTPASTACARSAWRQQCGHVRKTTSALPSPAT